MEIISIFLEKNHSLEVTGYAYTFCIREKKPKILGKTNPDSNKESGPLYILDGDGVGSGEQ